MSPPKGSSLASTTAAAMSNRLPRGLVMLICSNASVAPRISACPTAGATANRMIAPRLKTPTTVPRIDPVKQCDREHLPQQNGSWHALRCSARANWRETKDRSCNLAQCRVWARRAALSSPIVARKGKVGAPSRAGLPGCQVVPWHTAVATAQVAAALRVAQARRSLTRSQQPLAADGETAGLSRHRARQQCHGALPARRAASRLGLGPRAGHRREPRRPATATTGSEALVASDVPRG